MPDLGISKAIIKGTRRATVKREVETEFDALAARKAATPDPVTIATEPVISPPKIAAAAPNVQIDIPATAVPTAKPKAAPKAAPVAPMAPEAKVEPEARRLSQLNLGDYDLEATHQTNFDVLQLEDDVKAVIADTAERNKGAIDEARRGVITNTQLRGLAADLNVQEDVVRAVMERQSGGVLNAETILAARQVLNASADRVLTLAKKISSGQANDIERIQFRRQIMFHDDYQKGFMGARAETGRALHAFGIPVGLEKDGEKLARLKQTVEIMNGHDTDELATMLSQIDTVQGVNQFTKKYARSRLLGSVQELFINSILSGVKTHVVNGMSNALFAGMNIVETGLAARLGRVLPGEDHVMAGEASAMLFGQLTGFRDTMRVAAKSFRAGSSLDAALRYEGVTHRAISSENLFRDGIPHPSVAAAVDLVGTAIRAPTERLMAPMDEFAKAMAYRAELARQAYRHAMQQADGRTLSNDEISQLITDFMNDPPEGAVKAGESFANYATFQQPLGDTGRYAQRLVQNTPGMFLIAPFIRTPTNVFKAGLAERSPMALFSTRFWQEIKAGGPQRDMALARASLGTLTVGSIALAAASGSITGGGPQNTNARKILEATGWQPYSIRVEDPDTGAVTYQSYARAEPLAYVIGATADTVEILSYLDYDDELKSEAEQANNAIAAITAGVVNNTMSKTFLSGVADFSEALTDSKQYMQGYLEKTGSALIPFSSFRRQVGQLQDPTIREGWTFTDKLRASSGIPGFSEMAPPKRDVFGNPIYYRGGSLLSTMSPYPDTQGKPDRVLDEVVGLMNETRVVPVAMPGRRIEGLKLNADEYDELVRISRTEPIFNDGTTTFKEFLAETMDSEPYALATPDSRVALIKQIQESADKIAKQELETRNTAFADRISDYRLRKNRKLFGD